MKNRAIKERTGLSINNSESGERLEDKIERFIENGEGLDNKAPIIYTDRNEGVLASYNIRTDRWDIAVEGMDKVHKTDLAKRDNKAKLEVIKNEPSEGTDKGVNQ